MPSQTCQITKAVETAKLSAKLILENGGETSRAEETVYRICNTLGFDKTDVFAIPTGLFISVSKDETEVNTSVTRIRKRSTDLTAIEEVNSVSRDIAASTITIDEALVKLKTIAERKDERKLIKVVATGLAAGFFALMFNGSGYDFIAAAMCGVLVQIVANSIKFTDVFNFAVSILGGFIIGLGSVLFVSITGVGSLEKIIAGAIMPLLPGVPMVNAIKDTMRGDLLSGVSRGAEAVLIAVALAFGAGVVLRLYIHFAG